MAIAAMCVAYLRDLIAFDREGGQDEEGNVGFGYTEPRSIIRYIRFVRQTGCIGRRGRVE